MKPLYRLLFLVLAAAVLTSTAAAADLSLVGPVSGKAGDTVTVSIFLEQPPSGIAGYKLTVQVRDPGTAVITAAAFPDWAGLHDQSALPAESASLKAVNTGGTLQPGAEGLLLATLSVKLVKDGQVTLETGAVRIDDARGGSWSAVSQDNGSGPSSDAATAVVPTQPASGGQASSGGSGSGAGREQVLSTTGLKAPATVPVINTPGVTAPAGPPASPAVPETQPASSNPPATRAPLAGEALCFAALAGAGIRVAKKGQVR